MNFAFRLACLGLFLPLLSGCARGILKPEDLVRVTVEVHASPADLADLNVGLDDACCHTPVALSRQEPPGTFFFAPLEPDHYRLTFRAGGCPFRALKIKVIPKGAAPVYVVEWKNCEAKLLAGE